MAFKQSPPTLGNQFAEDRVLRSYLNRVLPSRVVTEVEPSLMEMGRLAVDLYHLQLADRLNEPKLIQWDAWGNRIDRIELTQLWQLAERVAVEQGLIATAYEQRHGPLSRIHQASLAYLFTPSTDIYSCPLAMTDGVARTLIESGNQLLIDRAVPHLLTRNRNEFWTAGQWMTELTGGSDVSSSETIARKVDENTYTLHGRKWFTSAISSQIALTLARPEENPPGSRGLALFYVETRDDVGRLQNIEVNRLKDKLGTRKVPTAELSLNGTPARVVSGTSDGVRNIVPLLNITRLWNGISAVALMRRGLALAESYADRRIAFGTTLSKKPLHLDTLAGLQAEFEAAFHLVFYVAELTGRNETSEIDQRDAVLLRILTPVMKLTTAKQAVAVASEILELFGGAGYVEDTGLPVLLRDSQVLPIWEGTTNVLALDLLRALRSHLTDANPSPGFDLVAEAERLLGGIDHPRLKECVGVVLSTLTRAKEWYSNVSEERATLEAGARRFALTVGRAMELALLIRHAEWSQKLEGDLRSVEAARRFSLSQIDSIIDL